MDNFPTTSGTLSHACLLLKETKSMQIKKLLNDFENFNNTSVFLKLKLNSLPKVPVNSKETFKLHILYISFMDILLRL